MGSCTRPIRLRRQTAALMHDETFVLRVKSGAWTRHPDRWGETEARLLGFDMTVTRGGEPLGGHNIQAHVTAPDQSPRGDVALELSSGWKVSLRNEFERAPYAAIAIFRAIHADLSRFTLELTDARGTPMVELQKQLWAARFAAAGPNAWR